MKNKLLMSLPLVVAALNLQYVYGGAYTEYQTREFSPKEYDEVSVRALSRDKQAFISHLRNQYMRIHKCVEKNSDTLTNEELRQQLGFLRLSRDHAVLPRHWWSIEIIGWKKNCALGEFKATIYTDHSVVDPALENTIIEIHFPDGSSYEIDESGKEKIVVSETQNDDWLNEDAVDSIENWGDDGDDRWNGGNDWEY